MTTREQRKAMQDYIVTRLDGSGVDIEPRTRNLFGKDFSYVLVGGEQGNGIVLLLDQHYSRDYFLKVHKMARDNKKDVAVVLIKDGKTFFRAARYRGHGRRKQGRSLKRYSVEQLQKLIMLHPVESFLKAKRTYLQYYQPESPKLDEGLECFGFKPAVFDYTHINPERRFGPEKKSSEKLFFWEYRGHVTGGLVLDGDYLKDRRVLDG